MKLLPPAGSSLQMGQGPQSQKQGGLEGRVCTVGATKKGLGAEERQEADEGLCGILKGCVTELGM